METTIMGYTGFREVTCVCCLPHLGFAGRLEAVVPCQHDLLGATSRVQNERLAATEIVLEKHDIWHSSARVFFFTDSRAFGLENAVKSASRGIGVTMHI